MLLPDHLTDKMVSLLWHLTPAELERLMYRPDCTGGMRIAASIRVEEATVWHYDNYDVPHYRGNVFYDWLKAHPIYNHPSPPPPVYDEDVPF